MSLVMSQKVYIILYYVTSCRPSVEVKCLFLFNLRYESVYCIEHLCFIVRRKLAVDCKFFSFKLCA